MEDYVDIIEPNYQQRDLKDLQPEARAVFERRVSYHHMISNLLKNDMIDVTEPVKNAPKNEEDKEEDEKQQEEEKKEEQKKEEEKKEEKALYEIQSVYRTIEKRLSQQPQNYVASSFGFKDKIGEGVNTFLHAFYDPSLDAGTITIKNNLTVEHIINKSLAEIDAQPIYFKFHYQEAWLDTELSADSQAQIF